MESKYNYLRALSSSDGGRGGLNLKLIRSIPIKIPSFNEQKKISDFIELIDKKRVILEKKYEHYQDFKKYLMQQIFAQKLRLLCLLYLNERVFNCSNLNDYNFLILIS